MPLVERDDLLAEFARARTAADGGAGRLLVVEGEAGSGKTSVVRAATDGALWGYCEPLSTPRPLGPFLDITRQLWPGGPHAADVGRLREALLERLESDAVTLVVEDAQWIDDASVDVLRFLGRRIERTRGLLVVTIRDEVAVDHPARRLLGDLASAKAVVRLRLRPLSAQSVGHLFAGTTMDPSEAYRLTRGNPFLVTQLLTAPDQLVTTTMQDGVAARVARLPPSAREVVDLLAVMPGRVPAAVVEGDWPAVDAGVLAGVLDADGAFVQFRHELVRLAIEHGLTPGRRRTLHAEALRRRRSLDDTEPATIAFHARQILDLRTALDSEVVAAERAAELGAHRQAIDHYRRAVADARTLGPPVAAASLWLRLCRQQYLVGDDEGALESAQAAFDALPPDADPHVRGSALRWLSRVTASEVDSQHLARAAVAILEPAGASRELAAAYALVATNHMIAREFDAVDEWARRAAELAARVDDSESLVIALQALGATRTLQGLDPDGADLWRAIAIARRTGDHAELGRAYSNLVSAAGEARLYELGTRAAVEALRYFADRDRELDAHASYTRAWYARCLFERGDWTEATTQVDQVRRGGAGNLSTRRCASPSRPELSSGSRRSRRRAVRRGGWPARPRTPRAVSSPHTHSRSPWPIRGPSASSGCGCGATATSNRCPTARPSRSDCT